MRISKLDERIQVLDPHSNVWSVLQNIANSGVQEEAFYIFDIGDVVRKHKIWKAAMPRVEPHYAVKCNDSELVIKVLAALGTNFDCASKGEISKVLSLGVEPERIIFANPAKPASHIRYASNIGVNTMTFDNESELHKIKQLFPDAKMVIRIRCDATIAQCQLGMKFGCDPQTEAPHLLRVAQSLGIEVVGVSFHVGSGCRDPPVFRKAIGAARKIFDYAETLGFRFDLLDIGGGYPGGRGSSIEQIAEIVNQALDDFFPDPNVQVIAEPGRFYVASAFTLATNIHSIRTVAVKDPISGQSSAHNMYYINDGVYGSFNCMLYDHQHVIPLVMKEYPNSKLYSSSIWGPTCDGLDQVAEDVLLPQMQIGDWIIFEDMGAYTLPVASPFNGFPVPLVHPVIDESVWVLLKDIMPLSDDNCGYENTTNLRNAMTDLDTTETWSLPITIPLCAERVIEYINIGSMN